MGKKKIIFIGSALILVTAYAVACINFLYGDNKTIEKRETQEAKRLNELRPGLEKVAKENDPLLREYILQEEAARSKKLVSDYRLLFETYRKNKTEFLPEYPEHKWSILAWGLWFFKQVTPNKQSELLKNSVLTIVEKGALITGAIALGKWLWESPQRKKQEQYQAWQIIHLASGQKASGARKIALEDLNRQKASLADLLAKEADLNEVFLKKANLSGADLSKANLSGADLSKANLSGANLSGADLSKANLSSANLSRANLSRANLSGANLISANLSGANLISANLSGANLSGANLSGANLSGANLSGANLSGANLSGADLSDANLSGADLRCADLSKANLSSANLSRAKLISADLSKANLSSANLSGADLSKAKLRFDDLGYIFSLFSVSLPVYLPVFFPVFLLTPLSFLYRFNTGANLRDANLRDANLKDTNLEDTNLESAKYLTPEQVKNAKNWEKAKYGKEFHAKFNLLPESNQ